MWTWMWPDFTTTRWSAEKSYSKRNQVRDSFINSFLYIRFDMKLFGMMSYCHLGSQTFFSFFFLVCVQFIFVLLCRLFVGIKWPFSWRANRSQWRFVNIWPLYWKKVSVCFVCSFFCLEWSEVIVKMQVNMFSGGFLIENIVLKLHWLTH